MFIVIMKFTAKVSGEHWHEGNNIGFCPSKPPVTPIDKNCLSHPLPLGPALSLLCVVGHTTLSLTAFPAPMLWSLLGGEGRCREDILHLHW